MAKRTVTRSSCLAWLARSRHRSDRSVLDQINAKYRAEVEAAVEFALQRTLS